MEQTPNGTSRALTEGALPISCGPAHTSALPTVEDEVVGARQLGAKEV